MPTFEPALLVNMLANMLVQFTIFTNMLGKKKKSKNIGQHLLNFK